MFDLARLGRVLHAYESYYKLKELLSRVVIEGRIERDVLLMDVNGIVNPNIVQMFNIILEKSSEIAFYNINISTHVPRFKDGVNIIRRELGPSIRESPLTRNYEEEVIITITRIIDYLFINFRIFLKNIALGIKKIDNFKSTYTDTFSLNIDLLFFFMIRSPDIHKGMLTDDILNSFARILNLNDKVYTEIKNVCNRGIIFIHREIYYICLYTAERRGDEQVNLKKPGSNKDLKAFKLSSIFGVQILLLITRKFRPYIGHTTN